MEKEKMIFVRIKKVKNIKRILNKEYMFLFFKKRNKKFLLKNEQLIDLKIHLVRNFRNKFTNMSLNYELITNKGNKCIRARIHKYQNLPEREWKIANVLKKQGLGENVIPVMEYFRPLNMLFYSEIPGNSFEELFPKKKFNSFIKATPLIAQWLKKAHSLKQKPGLLPIKDLSQEKKERRHWFFLVKKCTPQFYPIFSKLLKELWRFRLKNSNYFLNRSQFRLVHSDFHWGNIIKIHPVKSAECGAAKPQFNRVKNQFVVIDFCYGFYGDPLEDIGGFLAQNDSMFRYHAVEFLPVADKIRKSFLKNYFQNIPSQSEKARLLYFEIQKKLEMAAILSFLEPDEEGKVIGIEKLLKEAQHKLNILIHLGT
ncbi:hypothetical protein KKG58_03080 [Patescibacteria group bacterium]|nr:hypothetical protein [Patescibacteria group bacterium]